MACWKFRNRHIFQTTGLILTFISKKAPVKKGTWQDPQRKLGPVKPPQRGFQREPQSQMVSERPLFPRRPGLGGDIHESQRISLSRTNILAWIIHWWWHVASTNSTMYQKPPEKLLKNKDVPSHPRDSKLTMREGLGMCTSLLGLSCQVPQTGS